MTPRVGMGFDIHPFSADQDRPLVLGGVTLDGPGLVGHSDADAVAHAIADALLGAAGLGDIGTHFPDDDPAYAGVDSMDLLDRVVLTLSSHWEVGNVDVTVADKSTTVSIHGFELDSMFAKVKLAGRPTVTFPSAKRGPQ